MFCKSREIAIPIRDLALRIRNSALAMNSRKLFSNTSSSLKQVENIYMKQKIPLCVLQKPRRRYIHRNNYRINEILTELISPELLRRVAELIIEKHVYYFQNFYDWAFWKKNGSARRCPR